MPAWRASLGRPDGVGVKMLQMLSICDSKFEKAEWQAGVGETKITELEEELWLLKRSQQKRKVIKRKIKTLSRSQG